MIEKNESRIIIVPVIAKCSFCGSGRKIPHASPPVSIGKKEFQYIPSYTCTNCNKGNHPTFYEDIAKEISNIARKQSIKYAIITSFFTMILLSPISYILSKFYQLILEILEIL